MKYLSPEQCASLSDFSRAAIYRAIERGHLRAFKPAGTGRIRVREEDFTEWLEGQPIVPASPMADPIERTIRLVRSSSERTFTAKVAAIRGGSHGD